MSLQQETSRGLDPFTLNVIIEIQLEDSAALAGSAKGKLRQGTANDADVALQMFTDTCYNVFSKIER